MRTVDSDFSDVYKGGGGILLGLREMMARREEQRRHDLTRKDRDEWSEEALDLAKKLPPEASA